MNPRLKFFKARLDRMLENLIKEQGRYQIKGDMCMVSSCWGRIDMLREIIHRVDVLD